MVDRTGIETLHDAAVDLLSKVSAEVEPEYSRSHHEDPRRHLCSPCVMALSYREGRNGKPS